MTALNPTVPLGRRGYLLWGLFFFVVKIGVDALVARFYGHPYSLLFYVDPTTAPLLRPSEMHGYWMMLCYASAPFAALGVLLTLRRLRDAGLSPWLLLFFFVPFANLVFFLATACVPPYRKPGVAKVPDAGPFRSTGATVTAPQLGRRSRAVAIVYSSALGAVVALGGFAVSVGLMGKYGYGLAVGTPVVAGFVAGAWLPRLRPEARMRDAWLTCGATFVICVAVIVVFALEGLGCLILFLPLLFWLALFGTLLGFAIGRALPPRDHAVVVGTGVLLLVVTFGVERVAPRAPHRADLVETTVAIDAPPETVWPFVVRVDTMAPPTEAPFSYGIAFPIRATLDEDGMGSVRRCEFNTGVALETVTVWDEAKRLRFRIESQPDPLRELTLYRTVRQPHLDGAVRNIDGEFELVPLDGGRRTLLIGRSWYETSLSPTAYFEAYSDWVVHAIHRRVMNNVKARAESTAARVAQSKR